MGRGEDRFCRFFGLVGSLAYWDWLGGLRPCGRFSRLCRRVYPSWRMWRDYWCCYCWCMRSLGWTISPRCSSRKTSTNTLIFDTSGTQCSPYFAAPQANPGTPWCTMRDGNAQSCSSVSRTPVAVKWSRPPFSSLLCLSSALFSSTCS